MDPDHTNYKIPIKRKHKRLVSDLVRLGALLFGLGLFFLAVYGVEIYLND